MTATVTHLFPGGRATETPTSTVVQVDLDQASVELQAQRVESARRFCARRKRSLEISFFDVDGAELTVAPHESGLPYVTAAAVAFPLEGEDTVRDVMVGVTDPIPTHALADPTGTLAAIGSAIGDLMHQFLIHPAERGLQ